MVEWYKQSIAQTIEILATDLELGLREEVAQHLLDKYGPNELIEQAGKSPWKMLAAQFTETMVVILIVAALVSGLLGKTTETIAILAIVLMFAILGFIQEYRAERAMAALKKLSVPNVRARREGQVREIPALALVPGDILLLEAGNLIPADMRFVETANLRVQEAALTGESEPVEKHTAVLDNPDLPLGDRRNMGYMGTMVTYGRGVGVVVATGMDTELGRIATLLQQVEGEPTPLQNKLDQVGKTLAVVGLIAAVLVAGVGVLSGESLLEMFVTAVSVAVAVVPEGLPAVVTITLALGAQRLLKRKALIRKLPAVETLGSVTVICSDKTGTLTEKPDDGHTGRRRGTPTRSSGSDAPSHARTGSPGLSGRSVGNTIHRGAIDPGGQRVVQRRSAQTGCKGRGAFIRWVTPLKARCWLLPDKPAS